MADVLGFKVESKVASLFLDVKKGSAATSFYGVLLICVMPVLILNYFLLTFLGFLIFVHICILNHYPVFALCF